MMSCAFDFALAIAAGDTGEVPKKRRLSVLTKAMVGDLAGLTE